MVQDASTRIVAGLMSLAHRVDKDERGQDTLEWIMLSGLVAIAIVGAIGVFTGAINGALTAMKDCLDWSATTGCNPTAF